MTTKNIPRVSFTVIEKQMTQMLRFKVKKQRRTKQQFGNCCKHCIYNTLMASFAWNVCCLSRNLHYIFEDSIFSFGVLLLLLFCCYSKCTARNHQYIRLKVAATKVFFFFSRKSEQTAIQQSHIINPLLTSFARSVRESIAFGFYRTDLAPSSLGLYENLRQYFPVQTEQTMLINP